ncbi:MAG: DNA mismatch repair endonuclease MutL [Clostridia bacterium]|nr:DNA mismatch repair endonuclease MutL [Clostridia bacterium]
MGKINVLSFEIANLIAAGEVVERPSSVLKELLENSIDSGATQIVAEIKRGGVSLIRVTDNGSGIERDDLPVAIQRHATSKIREKDDLASIMTLGFRGEALAAISSVSEMTIISKTKTAQSATMLSAEAGRVVDISEVLAADGTTVVVNNLFYNVPARRKFLKKDATEAMNVSALVEKVALSRPDISIQLLIDGEEKFKTPGDNNLLNTIYAIFGKDFSSKLIEIDGEADGIHVRGYVGRSDNVKKNRNLMNVFINGRYVKSLTAQAAIERAYTSYIAPEAFPTCVLFIDINPTLVDVNVHPAKLEVKFADERTVFEIVYYTVKNALEKHQYRPEMELARSKPEKNLAGAFVPIGADTKGEQLKMSVPAYVKQPVFDEPKRQSTVSFKTDSTKYDFDKPLKVAAVSGGEYGLKNTSMPSMTPRDSVELLKKYRENTQAKEVEHVHTSPVIRIEDTPEYKFIGEAFDCYVMVEYEGALLVIDKHAAHERVIFEDLKKQREADKRIANQLLMLPLTVLLGHEELACATEYMSELQAVGFDYSVSGSAVDITAIPEAISTDDAEALFVKMLDEIIEGRGKPAITDAVRREKALYQVACKAAIKGGRVYTKEILHWLIKKLLLIPDITVCPHGRPVAFRLTKNELDRQFERLK